MEIKQINCDQTKMMYNMNVAVKAGECKNQSLKGKIAKMKSKTIVATAK